MRKATFVLFVLLLLLAVVTPSKAGVQFRGTELESWTEKLPPEILGGVEVPLWVGMHEWGSAILATTPSTQTTHLYFLPKGSELFQKVWDDSAEKTKLAEFNSRGTISVTLPSINNFGMVMTTRTPSWYRGDAQSFFFDPETLEVKLLFTGGEEGIKVIVANRETVIFDYKTPWPTSKTTFAIPLDLAYSLQNGVYMFDSKTDTFKLISLHGEMGNQLVRLSQVVGDSAGNLYWGVEGNLWKFDRGPRPLGMRAGALVNSGQIVLKFASYGEVYSESFSSLTPDGKINPLFGWTDGPQSSVPFNRTSVWEGLNPDFGVFPARYHDGSINSMMWNGEELVPFIRAGVTLPGNLGTLQLLRSNLLSSWGAISVYQDTGLFFSFDEAGRAENLYWFKKSEATSTPTIKIRSVVSATDFVPGEKFSAGEIATLFFTGTRLPSGVNVGGVDTHVLYSVIQDGEGQVNFFIPDSLKGLKWVDVVLKDLDDEDSFPAQIEFEGNPLPKPFMTQVLRPDGIEVETGLFAVLTTTLLDDEGKPVLDPQGIPRWTYVGPNDGSPGIAFHPTTGGKWVTMWATACGFANIADGQSTPFPGVAIDYGFDLLVGGVPAEIGWVGRTAGFRGLCQINFRIPTGTVPRIPGPEEPPAPRNSTPMWFQYNDGRRSNIFWLIVENY